MLYALRAADAGTARGCAGFVARPLTDDEEHAEALSLLRTSDALAEARATLGAYAERARAMLDALPDVPAREALATLCDLVLARTG